MGRQETIDRIVAYVKKLPDVDPEIVTQGMILFHRHRKIEMLLGNYTLKRLGISVIQINTLEILFHHQDLALTPAQLAEEVYLTRSAMTSNLDSLARKGYLSRAAHPDDRRKIVVSLTPAGIAFCHKTMPERYRDFARILKYFTPPDLETLELIYDKLLQTVDELPMEAAT